MALREWFRRARGRASAARLESPEPSEHGRRTPPIEDGEANPDPSAEDESQRRAREREFATKWLEAAEAGCLSTPRDVHDSGAWDAYWKNHLKVGPLEQAFSDQMSSDPELPGLLIRRGVRTILCAGNGLSNEALSLALLGFDVTALDISTVPAEVFRRLTGGQEHPVCRIQGFRARDDGSLTFVGSGPIDPGSMPVMHRSAEHAPRGGGSLRFATGDVTDAEVCPGPFDAVIERRTLQLFQIADQPAALERLAARLAPRGTFVSHQHCGGWRPGEARTHCAEAWLASRGFVLWWNSTPAARESAARLAHLVYSTG